MEKEVKKEKVQKEEKTNEQEKETKVEETPKKESGSKQGKSKSKKASKNAKTKKQKVENNSNEPKDVKVEDAKTPQETKKENEQTEKKEEIKSVEKQEPEVKQEKKQETTEKTEVEEKKKEEEPAQYKTESKKSNKKRVIAISILTTLIIAIMVFSVIFALLNMNNNKILKGISIIGIDVSDLTVEEATKQINEAISERFNDENSTLVLKRGENENTVTANTFNAKFDVDSAVAEAYNIGRDGNIVTNNYAILATKLFKKQIEPALYLDDGLVETTIKDISSKMEDAVKEYSYYVEDDELIIVNGKAGYIINQEKLKNQIYDEVRKIYENYQVIEIPVDYKEPDPIDLVKIHDEIYKEPKDAYVEKDPIKVHVEVNGVDFKISMEEAQKVIQEDKEEYTIPLKITVPEKTLSNLGEEAFPELLATFSTRYDATNRNRSTNIELASQKVNGTVLLPDETFSYNTVVGKRTLEAGFKEGTAYIGGKVVPDVGGGICQLSSTMYNTALLANLEIVERSNHLFETGYVSPSRDATVYYGSLDFRFKNTRSYPIKIVAESKNGVCKVSIYGIKEEKEYEVYIQSKVTSYISQKTTYKNDPTLEVGKEVVEQIGHSGCRSEAYRILKYNGQIVSQTLLSKDTYSPLERIIRKGTKK